MDETGCDERVQREYGWSRCGEVCLGTRVGRARERLSVVDAWHKDAAKPGLMAPLSFDGTCHSRWSEVWLRLMLCPLLRAGQAVILDNARFHRKKAVERILRRVGCTAVFLPPCSPDLNPIERQWHSFKTRVRTNRLHGLNFKAALEAALM
ncbi:MAG: IS630 family transposase [Acidimicrobiales bacterium]